MRPVNESDDACFPGAPIKPTTLAKILPSCGLKLRVADDGSYVLVRLRRRVWCRLMVVGFLSFRNNHEPTAQFFQGMEDVRDRFITAMVALRSAAPDKQTA